MSPALWWNDEEAFDLLATRAPLAEDQATGLFIAVGGLEEVAEIPALAPFKMVTNARRMADLLGSASESSLGLHFKELDGETHTSVIPVALTRALRTLLRPTRRTPDQS